MGAPTRRRSRRSISSSPRCRFHRCTANFCARCATPRLCSKRLWLACRRGGGGGRGGRAAATGRVGACSVGARAALHGVATWQGHACSCQRGARMGWGWRGEGGHALTPGNTWYVRPSCLRRRRRWNWRESKMGVHSGSSRKVPWTGSCRGGGAGVAGHRGFCCRSREGSGWRPQAVLAACALLACPRKADVRTCRPAARPTHPGTPPGRACRSCWPAPPLLHCRGLGLQPRSCRLAAGCHRGL